MISFRLHVFMSVATHLSFSKAAEELYISQPAVTKNIKELESSLDIKLLDRIANKVSITEAGYILLKHLEGMSELDKKLKFDLDCLKQKYSGQLKLAASTTIGQYVLPAILARFNEAHPEIRLSLFNDNTFNVESAINKKEIELAIVEGNTRNHQLKYTPFFKDEIVAIAHTSKPLAEKDEINLSQLLKTPLVLREKGSGSLDIIYQTLASKQIHPSDLNVVMHLGSTESIKSFLAQSNSIGLISINAISKELLSGEFKIIKITDLNIFRVFNFVHLHGKLSGLAQLFMDFAQADHNQK